MPPGSRYVSSTTERERKGAEPQRDFSASLRETDSRRCSPVWHGLLVGRAGVSGTAGRATSKLAKACGSSHCQQAVPPVSRRPSSSRAAPVTIETSSLRSRPQCEHGPQGWSGRPIEKWGRPVAFLVARGTIRGTWQTGVSVPETTAAHGFPGGCEL